MEIQLDQTNGGVVMISIKCFILIEVAIFQVDGTYIELLFLMNQKKFLPREFFFFFSGRVLTTVRHVTFLFSTTLTS